MKIITAYPIIENGKLVGNKVAANTLNYSSANGKKKKGGRLVGSGKVQGFLEKLGGVSTALGGVLGAGAAARTAPSQESAPIVTEEPKKGMTTTTKVLIGVGVAAVLGLGVYFVMKSKKGK